MAQFTPDIADAIRGVLRGEIRLDYGHTDFTGPHIHIFPLIEKRIENFNDALVNLDSDQSKRLTNLLTAYANDSQKNWTENRQKALVSFYIANLPITASTLLLT